MTNLEITIRRPKKQNTKINLLINKKILLYINIWTIKKVTWAKRNSQSTMLFHSASISPISQLKRWRQVFWVYLSTRMLWIYFWPKKVTGFNWWRWRGPWRNVDQRAVIEGDNLKLSEFVSRPVVAIGQRCYLLWQVWNRKAGSTGEKTAVVVSCSLCFY